jgi:serine phosphatase RsbU (regulator of sigma subunit)
VFENLVRNAEQNKRELSEALQQKAAISEILRAISYSPNNLQRILDIVAENAARLCDVTDAEIMQVEGGELKLVSKYGRFRQWPIGTTKPLNRDWVTGRAVVDRTSVQVPDLQAAEAEFPLGAGYAKQYGHRTVFATPLLREGVAIGAILIRRREARPLTDDQVSLLKTFADQAAIAIENGRLFTEIREKSRKVEEQAKELAEWNAALEKRVAEQVAQIERLSKLEHELSLASDIQKSMLPRTIPRLEGYEFSARMIPAKSVGGDFFDFIPLGEDVLGIAVGDVSDKGMPAALFMAMVRSLLRAEAHPGRSLQKVLRSVNHHLVDMNDKEMFVTILFGVLNSTTRQFQYVRAGHEAPIFFDGSGSFKCLPKTYGQALGVFNEIDLDEQTVKLSEGSMLLLYSDGIPEAPNRKNVIFGIEGLEKTVRRLTHPTADAVCDELIKAVDQHQAGALQYDDMTVVVVRAL